MNKAFIRVTWPDGQITVVPYNRFYSEVGPDRDHPDSIAIRKGLKDFGVVVLTNSSHPGKTIKVELVDKEALI